MLHVLIENKHLTRKRTKEFELEIKSIEKKLRFINNT